MVSGTQCLNSWLGSSGLKATTAFNLYVVWVFNDFRKSALELVLSGSLQLRALD